MPEIERKLMAIFAADVEGYSRLMGIDEVATLQTLAAHRVVMDGLIARRRGRIVGTAGDSVLAEFASVVDAVQCAVEVQEALAEANAKEPDERRMRFRIGVNVGDVLVKDGNIFGDGVNVAARLEALAEPGGICVSGTVRDHVSNKLPVSFADMGEQTVKNIARPVRVYRIDRRTTAPVREHEEPSLALPDKPSIVVLPFTNMSDDAEQEYFADGLTEDLITDLSKVAGLFVIARNSSFTYKGKAVDVRQVSREMGVRYVLEGSARRVANRVRINAQLIDAVAGGHLWAERFDRDMADIFAVQDEVIGKIVAVLAGKLTAGNLQGRRRTSSLDAYDSCVRGRLIYQSAKQPDDGRQARLLFEKAILLDPNYGEAYAWVAMSHWFAWAHWGEPADPHRATAISMARRSVALDPSSATAHSVVGFISLWERDWTEAAAELNIALRLEPSRADTWIMLAELMIMTGQPGEALECIRKAFRLDPHPTPHYYWILGEAQYAAGRYELAVETLRHAATYRLPSRRILAASLAQLGRSAEARDEASAFMADNPYFTIGYWVATQPFRDEAARAHFVEGYRKAGLPK